MKMGSSGNVGIGTSSPARGLSIHKEGNQLQLTTNTTGTAAGNGTDLKVDASTSDFQLLNYESANTTFWTSGAEAMRIDSSGNVGIGTSSPQAKLQVLDTLKVSTADQSSGSVILGDGSSANFKVGIARWNGATNAAGAGGVGYFAQGATNAGGHFFYTGDASVGSTTERMRIDSSGNVGIGTSSPSKKLSVKADGGGSQLGIDIHNEGTATGDDAVISFETQGSREFTMGLDRSSSSFVIAESGTLDSNQRLVIDDSGNLLVGKTADNNGVAGTAISNIGAVKVTRTDWSLLLNRLTTDGQMALFQKDGTTVGSIGVASNDLNINGGANHSGIRFQATGLYPLENGTASSGEIDLGAEGSKLKRPLPIRRCLLRRHRCC